MVEKSPVVNVVIPIFYFHGTPDSRHEPRFSKESAQEQGYCLIAPDVQDLAGLIIITGARL